MPKLIKDFRDFHFVYYWYEQGQGQLSPNLPTLTHAQEWIRRFQNAEYKGLDRRKQNRSSVLQRRFTDKKLHIDVDMSSSKIAELKQAYVV